MRLICGAKPMSSMRSASSSTSTSRSSNTTFCRSRWSIRRPGVATTMSTPARSFFCCGSMRHAAVHRHDAQLGVSRVLVHAFLHLDAQLARRREDQRARPLRTAEKSIDDGKRERGGLAGSRLREPHHVAPLEHQRNRIRLDRGRRLIARVGDCFQHFTRESDLLECRRFGLRHLLHFSCLDFHDTHRCAPGPRTQDHPGTGVSQSCRRAEGAPNQVREASAPLSRGALRPTHLLRVDPHVRDRPGGSHQSDPCRGKLNN